MAYIETIVECYIHAAPRCDMDLLLSYYHDDVLMLTPEGAKHGKMQARIFLTQFYSNPPHGYPENFQLIRKDIDSDYAYLLWSAGEALPMVNDVLHIKNGKVAMHSFALCRHDTSTAHST